MSEYKGSATVDPGSLAAGGGTASLVAPAGLAPRQAQAGGLLGSIGPVVRAVHGWTSTYFAAILLLMIAVGIALT